MRRCSNFNCSKPISDCFGFVHAGDFIKFLDGKKEGEDVRELCGLCSSRALFIETDKGLESFLEQIN